MNEEIMSRSLRRLADYVVVQEGALDESQSWGAVDIAIRLIETLKAEVAELRPVVRAALALTADADAGLRLTGSVVAVIDATRAFRGSNYARAEADLKAAGESI